MRNSILTIILIINYALAVGQNWTIIKDTVSPTIELTSEYDSVFKQPLSGLGWEDGVHISRDGLNLYCTYVPIDLLSFTLNGDLPNNFSANYLRGAPDFGMDLTTNPIGATEWLHSDILFSSRNSLSDSFVSWQLSNMSRPFYSEGAPTPSLPDGLNSYEFMLFTSNDNSTNNMDIWLIETAANNPSGTGVPMPPPITTEWNEDNPHLIRTEGDTLLLFYDSDNLPGGVGDIDLWYSVSVDNGSSWSIPSNLTSVNTSSKEHQPFVFYDHSEQSYYLYYSAIPTDGKLAIFRRKQMVGDDWDSWGGMELVISAGNSAGIGEPTLTDDGDISFVVVYEDPEVNSIYNRFDSDPWILKRKTPILSNNDLYSEKVDISIHPNPSRELIFITSESKIEDIKINNNLGTLYFSGTDKAIDIRHFPKGSYHISILTESGKVAHRTFIKE